MLFQLILQLFIFSKTETKPKMNPQEKAKSKKKKIASFKFMDTIMTPNLVTEIESHLFRLPRHHEFHSRGRASS